MPTLIGGRYNMTQFRQLRFARVDLARASWLAVLVAGTAAARIAVYLRAAAPLEDALISLRYARNIANGLGFVYNPGEHVLGTTTPLWTLINALYIWLFGTARLFAFGFWLNLGLDLITLACLLAILERAGISRGASMGAVIPFAFYSPFVFITSSHMEICLFMALLVFSLMMFQSGRTCLCAFLAGLLAVCRPEGFLWLGLLLTVVAWQRRQIPWKEAGVAGMAVAPWFVFAAQYFGHVVPQSALAKAPWTFQSLPHVLFSGAKALPATFLASIYGSPLPALPVLSFAGAGVVIQTILAAAFLAGAYVALGRSGPREMVLLFLVFVCFYAFAAPGVFFPWYGVSTSFLFYPVLILGLSHLNRIVAARLAPGGGALSRITWAAGCAVLVLGLAGGLFVRSNNLKLLSQYEEGSRKAIGTMLASETPTDAKILLEPIGYIGFFSNRYVYDLAGLVSPSMVGLRRRYPTDWYLRAIFSLSPDYLILRKFEVDRNVCFVGGESLFKSEEDRTRFFHSYLKIREFSGMAVHGNETQYLMLFRRIGSVMEGPHLPALKSPVRTKRGPDLFGRSAVLRVRDRYGEPIER